MRIELASQNRERQCSDCRRVIRKKEVYAKQFATPFGGLETSVYKVLCASCVKEYYSKLFYELNEHIFIPLQLPSAVWQTVIQPNCPKCFEYEYIVDNIKYNKVFIIHQVTCLKCRARYEVKYASYSKDIIINSNNISNILNQEDLFNEN